MRLTKKPLALCVRENSPYFSLLKEVKEIKQEIENFPTLENSPEKRKRSIDLHIKRRLLNIYAMEIFMLPR